MHLIREELERTPLRRLGALPLARRLPRGQAAHRPLRVRRRAAAGRAGLLRDRPRPLQRPRHQARHPRRRRVLRAAASTSAIEAELRALVARKASPARRRPERMSARLRLPRAGLAEGRHGPRAGLGGAGEPRPSFERGRRRAGLPALAAVLRGARRGAAAHRQHAAGDPDHQRRRVWALERRGLRPDWVAGHSLGEYSALVAAGALDAGRRRGGRAPARTVHAGGGAGGRGRDGRDPRARPGGHRGRLREAAARPGGGRRPTSTRRARS